MPWIWQLLALGEDRTRPSHGTGVYLGDGEITVVERGGVQPDEYVVVTELWHRGFLALEAVEALVAAGDHPLLLFRGYRHGWLRLWIVSLGYHERSQVVVWVSKHRKSCSQVEDGCEVDI